MRTIVAIGLVATLMGAPIQARAENGQVAAGILGGLAARFASSPIRWAASGPIRWFGSKLVEQIGLKLLARPFCRRQLLRAYGSPSEAPAGPLSLPVLSLPSSFRLRVGRYLT